MLTILDIDHPWAATVGSRDRSERLAFMGELGDVRYVLVSPGPASWTEAAHHDLIIEHVEAPRRPGSTSDHGLLDPRRLRDLIQLHRPNVIQCGSPALLPALTSLASLRLDPRPALIGTWRVDLPVGVVRRGLEGAELSALRRLARVGERAAWAWTRLSFGRLDAVFVGSRARGHELIAHGIERLYYTPPGIDLHRFSPGREPLEAIRRGAGERPAIWMPVSGDAVDRRLIRALCVRLRGLDPVPMLVLAGPRDRLEAIASALGDPCLVDPSEGPSESGDERARVLASCELALFVGGPDGSGRLCAEAMACGLPVVSFAGGDVGELVRESGCGLARRASGGPLEAEPLVRSIGELLANPERRELGQRGRRFVARFDWRRCFERELACQREVHGLVRAGQRVSPGLHERLMPSPLSEASRASRRGTR